ncbi:hypothetical protein [Kribbella sp. CA-293567]|uniref:hypothetical protein n=1 Tax=Kribbella sp. CA-293567 TaxID=3002436 RepID=UPI0022DCFA64|nr:hypothetical protein [Kribbella sp. CA-293567]WBQ02230.1 hypothetical protein OX958_19805 [Kribbella sp. CA-293567]
MVMQRGRLWAGAAALVLASATGVIVVTRPDNGAAPGGTASAAEGSGRSNATSVKARRTAIDKILAQRATAVVEGDLNAFLASVDPQQPKLVAEQRVLFGNLRQFRFTTLRYSAADERPAPAMVTKYGRSAYSTRVMMRYQLTGLDPRPVQTDLGYTFAVRRSRWILVADDAIDETLSEDGHRQPWDFRPITVIRRGKVVVVVDKTESALGRKIGGVSQSAVAAVRRHWPRPWNGAVMVVAMSEPRVMSMLWTTGTGAGWTIAAKAVTLYDGDPRSGRTVAPVGSRIVINPAVRKNLDEDLLVHEMTHVATVPIGVRTPTWLVEGVAEYVRCRSIEDDPQWTVDPYRSTVKKKYLPSLKVLPGEAQFAANGDRSYGQAWWATEYLVSTEGVKGMASLYTDLALHGTSPAASAAIIKKHTGRTPAELVAAVRTFRG